MNEMVDTSAKTCTISRFNSLKHGVCSEVTVLPHESIDEYESLLGKFMEEYAPKGPTQTALVQDLASIVWRKHRVQVAECASINTGLARTLREPLRLINSASPFRLNVREYDNDGVGGPIRKLLSLDDMGMQEYRAHLQASQESLQKARERLEIGGRGAARQAIELLAPSLQDLWFGADRYSDTIDEVDRFIEHEAQPKVQQEEEIFSCVQALRQQALGSALNALPFDLITRYEAHLDRKFEKTLSMLIKLKAMSEHSSKPTEVLDK